MLADAEIGPRVGDQIALEALVGVGDDVAVVDRPEGAAGVAAGQGQAGCLGGCQVRTRVARRRGTWGMSLPSAAGKAGSSTTFGPGQGDAAREVELSAATSPRRSKASSTPLVRTCSTFWT